MTNNLLKILAFSDELHSLVKERVVFEMPNVDDNGLFLSFVLAKAYKTSEAVVLLCRNGYGEDAFMLTRTIFELLITAAYILQDETGDRLVRYLSYDWVTRKKMYDYIRTKPELLASLQNHEEVLAEVERECAAAQAKYGYRFGWSDQGIDGMARSVGREDMYRTVYSLQCVVGHTSARSVNEYVTETEDGMVFNVGPNWNLAEKSLVILFDCYFHIVREANLRFGWNLTDRLESMSKRYLEAVGSL